MNIAAVIDKTSPENRQRALALAASILAHLLIILLIGFVLAARLPLAKVDEPDETVELTIIDPPTPQARQEPQYVDSAAMTETEKPPETAPFESDKNTAASSALPANGQTPLPTLQGEETKGLELVNREYVAGQRPAETAPPSAPSKPSESAPQEQAEAAPTPRPMAQLALLEPPKKKVEPRPTPEQVQPDQQPPQPQSKPAQPSAPGYQPQTRVTRIQGNISNRGRPSLAAQATPLGRYKKMLSDAIGSRWYYYVNQQMGLLTPGTLEVAFIVRADGKVEKLNVVRNSSNESFASCSVGAIMEAEIPPIPKELAPMLEGNRIEIEYSFTILSQ